MFTATCLDFFFSHFPSSFLLFFFVLASDVSFIPSCLSVPTVVLLISLLLFPLYPLCFSFFLSTPSFISLLHTSSTTGPILSLFLSLSLSPSLFCCISLSHYQQRHLDRSGDIHTSAAVLKYSDRCVNARVCESVKYNVYTHTHIHRFMS